jgi:signal transduction histidine kinase
MTIHQRLTISNLLMLVIPVLISAMIFGVCMCLIWIWSLRNTNSRFADSADFYTTCDGYRREVEAALEEEPEDSLLEALDAIGARLDWQNVSLLVEQGGNILYAHGEQVDSDQELKAAMEYAGGNGYISVDDRALFAFVVERDGEPCQVMLSGPLVPPTFSKLRTLTGCAIAVLIISVILAAYLTNRFLIRFAFQKIQEPIEVLTKGVEQLSDGNLDYQIQYDVEDEFTPICDSFNHMTHQLKNSMELIQKQEENRKELLAGISHDLRSPLTNISAYANGLLDGVAQTEEDRIRYLCMIRDKSNEMIRMVSRLIQFSKMDLGDYPDYPEKLLLSHELQDLLEALTPEYREKGLDITYQQTGDGYLYADPEQLRGILVNIIDNSWKYKTKDLGHLEITLSKEQGLLRLSLRDDGPGVPQESLPKLFEAFYRSDPARKNPGQGSGLGLAIAAHGVRRMGGNISAETIQPTGLEILITLPEMKRETEGFHE